MCEKIITLDKYNIFGKDKNTGLIVRDVVSYLKESFSVKPELIANYFKEQRTELIPELTMLINKFFEKEASEFNINPLTLIEIQSYYESDAKMWAIFQNVRRLDRFLKTKVFRKKYDFYLPGKIKR